ncbi:MAG: hypothetical protein IKB11_08300 [Bacteroidaceae bacterium]|nr:hypothetical protein [Bacteroidaceae bacterium]
MRNVTNKNSSAKTVAGENTTENINEQVETAPVINQLNNEETIMEEIVFQSSMAPQAGACETTPGSGVKETATVSGNESATVAQVLTNINTSTVHDKKTTEQEIPASSLNATFTKALMNEEEMKRLLSWEKFFYSDGIFTKEKEEFMLTFNEKQFGTEIDYDVPRLKYKAVDECGCINLFDSRVWYISVYNFDCHDPRYSILNTLPDDLLPFLSPEGIIHAKLVLDYPFDGEYIVDFDFKTTNDVLSEIKEGFIKMYATLDTNDRPYGEPNHSIVALRVESLSFNPKNNRLNVFIGS